MMLDQVVLLTYKDFTIYSDYFNFYLKLILILEISRKMWGLYTFSLAKAKRNKGDKKERSGN